MNVLNLVIDGNHIHCLRVNILTKVLERFAVLDTISQINDKISEKKINQLIVSVKIVVPASQM